MISIQQSPLFEPVLWNGGGFKILDELLVPERIELPISEYERVRGDATKFVVEPGHVKNGEQVLAQRRRYAVIRKVDRAMAAIVRRLNPRPKTA